MGKFAERLKQAFDSRLPHFLTSIPYIVATILIMLVPLTVVLTQQETKTRSQAQQAEYPVKVIVTSVEDKSPIANARVSVDYQSGGGCTTDSNGNCTVPVSNDGEHTAYAYKQDEFDLASKPFTINAADDVTIVYIALTPVKKQGDNLTPSPGSKSYEVTITVRDDQSGKLISGAFVSLDHGSGGGCTTHAEGICAFTVYKERNYQLHVKKEGYADRDTTFPVKSSQTNINIDMVREDGGQPPADDTEDPNSGGPNDTPDTPDGSNPPGPDDLKCLGGSCETPTPTPAYCITPAPSGDTPPDTGKPLPDAQSIFDMVRQRINETFSRFGDFFNINPKPPPSP